MIRAEILETVWDDRDQVIICVLDDDGPDGSVRVVWEIDPELGAAFMRDRIYSRAKRRWLTADDGALWLRQLRVMYSGSRLRARVTEMGPETVR
jgi:hypothetical protein